MTIFGIHVISLAIGVVLGVIFHVAIQAWWKKYVVGQ